MVRHGTTNYELKELLSVLGPRAIENRFWKRIVKDLMKPSRQRRSVNLYKIAKYARDGEMVIVPGKVLSVGELGKKVDVAALHFSSEARLKIQEAKGRVLTIKELLQENPDGKKVRILG